MKQQTVLLSVEGGVATITLNRPEVRNALSPRMLEEFGGALDECAAEEEVRAVVITGSGPAFCSGGDVGVFTGLLDQGPQEMSSQLQAMADKLHRNVILKIRQLPKPVIASMNGVAAGAGFSLALACDLRIASQETRFFMAYSNIGSTADGGSTYFLPRLVGPGLAMEVYMANQPISAQRALEMGLVNRVVPAEELLRHTTESAQRLASGPTLAYAKMRTLIDRALSSDLDSQLHEEARALGEISLTGDFREGISAFMEKRAPQFQGK